MSRHGYMVAATMVLVPGVAAAQTQSAPTPPPPPGLPAAKPVAATAADASSAAADSSDIVVTAQRRSERLSQVPISITAFSARSLAATGVSDARALTQITPGLNFQSVGNSAQPFIRGIGSTGSSLGDSSNVATYIDGVYQPSQFGNFLRFVDLERIEVLKGPQGTLFGRNAAGGAISVTTLEPSLTRTTGRLGVSYARFGEREATGFATTPLTEDLAVSLSGSYLHSDGFRKDIFLDRELGYIRAHSARGKLLWEPSKGVRALLTGYYSYANDLTTFGNQPLDGNTSVRARVPSILIPTTTNTSALNVEPANKVSTHGGSLRLEFDTPMGELTSLSAFTHARNAVVTDSDLTPAAFSQSTVLFHDNTISQELTLASSSSARLQYLAGGTFYRERADYLLNSFGGLLVPGTAPLTTLNDNPIVKIDAVAVFAELTYAITPRLTVVVGARYSDDSIGYIGRSFSVQTGLPTLVVNPTASFANFSPRASLRYQITPTINAYASFSRGFKAGVFNTSGLASTAVEPEKVDAYEVGIKGAPSSVLSFDSAAYYYDYRNVQFAAFGASALQAVLRNAAAAEIYGFEANLRITPVREFGLRLGGAYTHGEYTRFPGAQGFRPTTNAAGVPIGGNTSFTLDASGRPVIRTPRVQVNGTISYDHDFSGGGAMSANLTGSYNSRIFYDLAGNTSQKPYSVANANLSYTTSNAHWRGTLFGTNIFNTKYIQGILISSIATAVTFSRPATYGARIEYLF